MTQVWLPPVRPSNLFSFIASAAMQAGVEPCVVAKPPFNRLAEYALTPWPREIVKKEGDILAELQLLKEKLEKEKEADPLVIPLKLENVDDADTEPEDLHAPKIVSAAEAKWMRAKKAKNLREKKRKRKRVQEKRISRKEQPGTISQSAGR